MFEIPLMITLNHEVTKVSNAYLSQIERGLPLG
jgi:hypothetical protein